MSEIHWEPTAHLRFVNRLEEVVAEKYSDGSSVNQLKKVKVLQQKWVKKEYGPFCEFDVEWRDATLEVDE